MVSRTIPDQDCLHVWFQPPRQLSEKNVDDARIETWCDQPFGVAGLGTGCRQHIDEPILRLPDRSRARTSPGPHTGQRPLLAETGFVFVIDLQSAIWLLCLDLTEPLTKLF